MQSVFSCAYFPNISYMAGIAASDSVSIEKHENFIRQTYRSRCRILGPHGILDLNIPVRGARKNVPIMEIQIDTSQRWQAHHWKSITSVYSKAPFFEHYEYAFRPFFAEKWNLLFDAVFESMTLCLDILELDRIITFTEEYQHTYAKPNTDLRVLLNSKKLNIWPTYFYVIPYTQVFSQEFIPNLSVLDLIFCEGPGSKNLIANSFSNSL